MNCHSLMKRQKTMLLAGALLLAVLLVSFNGFAATEDPLPVPSTAPDVTPRLSPPVREVVKMVTSGVPEVVVKAYIENFPSAYNLTPENIIHLQEIGVSTTLTTTMLNHDKQRRENAGPSLPPSVPSYQPPAVAGPDGSQLPNDYSVYDNLAPYGYWNDVPDYGWCWQPYSWIGYNAYPWGWLGFGCWRSCPGRGWCWFPRSHFRGFDPLRANRGLFAGRVGQLNSRNFGHSLAVRNTFANNHLSSPFRAPFGGGLPRIGGGGGGIHASSHIAAGGSFHGGGGGIHTGGGGGGSFHGGGRGHR